MKTILRLRMALFIFSQVLLFSVDSFSQLDTSFALPPGYLPYQLRPRNVLKVNPSGDVWVGFQRIGVGIFNGSSWTVHNKTNSGLPGNNVTALAFDGTVSWIGTDSGLVKFDGINWTLYDTTNSGLSSNIIKLLYVHNGNLWIAFGTGLQRFDGMNWVSYNTSNGLVNDTVQCFGSTSSSLFVGTQNGLSEFHSGAWINYNLGAGGTDSNNIVSMSADGNDTLFVSPKEGGLNLKSGTSFQQVSNYITPNCGEFISQPVKLMKSVNGSIACLTLDGYSLYEIESSTFQLDIYDLMTNGVPFYSFRKETCDMDQLGRIWIVEFLNTYHIDRLDYLNFWPPVPPLPDGHAELNINEVKAELHNNGDMFWDGVSTARYMVPQGQCAKSALYMQSLWVGGRDQSNNLHVSAQMYRQSGNDFWPGPLDTVSCISDSASSTLYNHIWVVERWKIMEFITNFNNGNVTNGTYAIPAEILDWPGNGTGRFARSLAPFVDVNLDGSYNPILGDYPDIKGDQMAWWVMNDSLYAHGESGGAAFGVEIQVSAYAYFCPLVPDSEKTINFTTFYSYKIINRSVMSYHDVYLGLYTDADLGSYDDDYIGCNVDYDFAYCYNGDQDDQGIMGYGLNPPVINVALLNGPYADTLDAIDNNHNGIIDEPGEHCMLNHFQYFDNDLTNYGNPQYDIPPRPMNFYNYITSHWLDSTHVTYGNSGHTGIGDSCNYMFPGTSDPTGYGTNGVPHAPWDELTSGNMPADRRFVMSTGPFTMAGGEVNHLEYAIVYTRELNPVIYPQSSLDHNLAEVRKVKDWWAANSFPAGCALTTGIPEITNPGHSKITIYPNPAAEEFSIYSAEFAIEKVELYDVLGQRVLVVERDKRNNEPITINIARLARGVYFVKARGKDFTANAKLIRE